MFINFIFMLILSSHITTTISINGTSSSHPETQNLQITTNAPLPITQKIKPDETAKKLSRGIANTSIVHEANNNSEKSTIKIVTEGSGVYEIKRNDTSSIVSSGTKEIAGKVLESTTPAPPTIAGNSTKMITHFNDSNSIVNNKTIKTTLLPKTKTSIVVKSSTTGTTTSTTVTSTTTTTTTTAKPKKPTMTYPEVEIPGSQSNEVNAQSSSSNNKFPSAIKSSSTKLSVEDPETPHVQLSQELDDGLYRSHRDYIIPIVSIIFAVPILMGMVIVAYRRFRDFWSTRHYRRMDFLVDGMYND